jgi:hypothetical protein
MQPDGCAPEVQLFGHGDEIAQVAQLHRDLARISIGME